MTIMQRGIYENFEEDEKSWENDGNAADDFIMKAYKAAEDNGDEDEDDNDENYRNQIEDEDEDDHDDENGPEDINGDYYDENRAMGKLES